MTKEEIERIVSFFPLLPPPKNIIVLDGVIDVDHHRIALGAYPNLSNYIVLTSLSNETTFIHEWLHYSLGVGELLAYTLSERMARWYQRAKGFSPRTVQYQENTLQNDEAAKFISLLGLEPLTAIPPEIKHYKLVSSPIRRLQLLR